MQFTFNALAGLLAQYDPSDDAPQKVAAPTQHPFSFSDLQQGLRAANNGDPHDRTSQVVLLVMVGVVALIALLLHLRQRHKEAGPPHSPLRLAWELSRHVRFPMGSRLLLVWVSRTTKVPLATLLISGHAFDSALDAWLSHPTFGPLRRWGSSRLEKLKPILFGAS